MRIEITGRNVELTDDLRSQVTRRLDRVAPQVSELAVARVELREERNPAIADRCVAEITLSLKGTTLRAREAAPKFLPAITGAVDDVRRQVKRHGEKRRRRAEARRTAGRERHQGGAAPGAA